MKHTELPSFDADRYLKVLDRITDWHTGDGCWVIKTAREYPVTDYKVAGKTKHLKLSRLLLYWATGNQGDEACHKCNNPKCVNVAHLYWGTKSDNMRDRAKAGNAYNQILLPADIYTIRQKRTEGATVKELANIYNVSPSAMYRIVKGKRWGWL